MCYTPNLFNNDKRNLLECVLEVEPSFYFVLML